MPLLLLCNLYMAPLLASSGSDAEDEVRGTACHPPLGIGPEGEHGTGFTTFLYDTTEEDARRGLSDVCWNLAESFAASAWTQVQDCTLFGARSHVLCR